MSHRGLQASPIMLRERVLRKDTDGVLRTVQKQLSIGQGDHDFDWERESLFRLVVESICVREISVRFA